MKKMRVKVFCIEKFSDIEMEGFVQLKKGVRNDFVFFGTAFTGTPYCLAR